MLLIHGFFPTDYPIPSPLSSQPTSLSRNPNFHWLLITFFTEKKKKTHMLSPTQLLFLTKEEPMDSTRPMPCSSQERALPRVPSPAPSNCSLCIESFSTSVIKMLQFLPSPVSPFRVTAGAHKSFCYLLSFSPYPLWTLPSRLAPHTMWELLLPRSLMTSVQPQPLDAPQPSRKLTSSSSTGHGPLSFPPPRQPLHGSTDATPAWHPSTTGAALPASLPAQPSFLSTLTPPQDLEAESKHWRQSHFYLQPRPLP